MSDIAALFTWVNMRFLLQGLGMTLLISALAILCSVVLGTVISVMRTSNARVLRGIATVYIEIFKNTPLLLWIMFTFFVAQLPPIGAAVLAFTLFTSASVAEIVRGGRARAEDAEPAAWPASRPASTRRRVRRASPPCRRTC